MNFRISQRLRSLLTDVASARLNVRLRYFRTKVWKKKVKKLNRKHKKLTSAGGCTNKTTEHEKPASKRDGELDIVRCSKKRRIRIDKVVTKLNRLKKKKPRQVKLVVRYFDQVKQKRRSIYRRDVVVKDALQMVTIPVPKEILENAAKSSNHTLIIQIKCRRCYRKAVVDRVYRRPKKHKGNKIPKLNYHRPLLTIVYKESSKSNNVVRRNKRHLQNKFCEFQEEETSDITFENNNYYVDASEDFECCMEKKYFSFEELGVADKIIYPYGFTTAICMGKCGMGGSSTMLGNDQTKKGSISSSNKKQCRAVDSSHLDILYLTDSNTVAQGQLTNFIDNSCGCAS